MFRSERWAPVRRLLQQHFKSWKLAIPPADAYAPRLKILVLGIFLSDRDNCAEHLVAAYQQSRLFDVDQRWAGIWGPHDSPSVRAVTQIIEDQPINKFALINKLLKAGDVETYDYILVSDDDIVVPGGFLDAYIQWQRRFNLALAQPSRAIHSHYDHKITVRRPWLVARETRFVEIGPVFSVARRAYPHIVPFDTRLPMGWGLDLIWPVLLKEHKMGIIDAVSVDHSYRPQGVSYSRDQSIAAMNRVLAETPHLSLDAAHTTLEHHWRYISRHGDNLSMQ